MIRCKVLTRERMKPSKLEHHFESCRGELTRKLDDFFKRKSENLKNLCFDSSGVRAQQNNAVFEASYRIAQSKKPYTIGEELIKPCLIKAISLMLRAEAVKQVKRNFAFKNDKIKYRISEMTDDILLQVVEGIRSSPELSCIWTNPTTFLPVFSYSLVLATSLEITYKRNI